MVHSPKTVARALQTEYADPTPATEPLHFSALLDPALLQAARHIYQTYYEVHPEQTQRPIGIALDRYSYRGKLIFGAKPVLLPKECFIPLSQIESGLH